MVCDAPIDIPGLGAFWDLRRPSQDGIMIWSISRHIKTSGEFGLNRGCFHVVLHSMTIAGYVPFPEKKLSRFREILRFARLISECSMLFLSWYRVKWWLQKCGWSFQECKGCRLRIWQTLDFDAAICWNPSWKYLEISVPPMASVHLVSI